MAAEVCGKTDLWATISTGKQRPTKLGSPSKKAQAPLRDAHNMAIAYAELILTTHKIDEANKIADQFVECADYNNLFEIFSNVLKREIKYSELATQISPTDVDAVLNYIRARIALHR